MKVTYSKNELANIIEAVRDAENSDYMGRQAWARAAKVLEALAADRLELLRRWNDKRVHETHEDCPFCGMAIHVDTTPPSDTKIIKIIFEDSHTDGCELAEEIGGQDE